jgi:hypothetical protein
MNVLDVIEEFLNEESPYDFKTDRDIEFDSFCDNIDFYDFELCNSYDDVYEKVKEEYEKFKSK